MRKVQELFKRYGIDLDKEKLEKFEKFLKMFVKTNSQINLSGIKDEAGIIEKHFIDSIMLKKFFLIKGKVLDLGTGGGFPGIPLKIVDENNADFVLIDSIGKKVKAVNEFIENLGLKNIVAIQARAEKLGQDPNHRGKYDVVVSRAVAYLPVLLEYAMPLLKVKGTFIGYKLDDDEEIREAKKALEILGGKIVSIKRYALAGQKRIFLFIEKIKNTSKKYPRAIGIPAKNPIK